MSHVEKSKKNSSERSLFERFRLNALSYGYGQIVTICSQLGLVPFFLKYWGTELYADWLVLTGIPFMLILLDLGVAKMSANRVSLLASSNDIVGVRRSLQTSFAFTLCLIAVVFLLAIIMCILFDWSHILGLSYINKNKASEVFLIMSAYLCISLLGGPLEAWFKAIDQTALGAFLLANRRMADIIVSIIVLVAGLGVFELAVAMLITQTIVMVFLVIIANRLSSWPLFGLRQASWYEFLKIWKPAIAYAGFSLSQVITLQGGVQVLNQVASPAVVVGFTMARTMMRLIIQLGIVSNNALMPEISRFVGRGEIEQAKHFTLRATAWISGICCFIYLCGVIVGPYIIDWWSHGQVLVGRFDLVLIGFHALLNVVWFVPAAFLIAVNKHVFTASIYGFSSVFSLLLWISFDNVFSPVFGASLLLSFPELVVLFFYMYRFFVDHKKA